MGIDRTGSNSYVICTSSTRPAAPVAGTMIYETDTTYLQVYDGSNWRVRAPITAKVRWTGGAAAITSATFADLPTIGSGVDVTVPAVAGDIIGYNVIGQYESEAVYGYLDGYIAASGNYLSGGAGDGIPGMFGHSAHYTAFGCLILYTVVSGDVSSGNVTVRLRGRISGGTKTLRGSTIVPLFVQLTNRG